jgi:hypothetical protein
MITDIQTKLILTLGYCVMYISFTIGFELFLSP